MADFKVGDRIRDPHGISGIVVATTRGGEHVEYETREPQSCHALAFRLTSIPMKQRRLDYRLRSRNATASMRSLVPEEGDDFYRGFEAGFFEGVVATLEPDTADGREWNRSEPGQVAVLLDASEVRAISHALDLAFGALSDTSEDDRPAAFALTVDLRAILDRAREASR